MLKTSADMKDFLVKKEQRQSSAVTAVDIVRLLRQCRFDLSSEKHLQRGVEEVLKNMSVEFEREKRMDVRNIPDFLVAGGIVVECKLRNKWTKMDVYKQLARYAPSPSVTAIILAANFSMGMPGEIDGKPVYLASLSAGWM